MIEPPQANPLSQPQTPDSQPRHSPAPQTPGQDQKLNTTTPTSSPSPGYKPLTFGS